jgi:hypothetical protein
LLCVLSAKAKVLGVGPTRLEFLTSAVRRQREDIVVVR